MIHVADTMRVELAAYQIKSVFRTLFDQWKWVRVEGAPSGSWAYFEKVFFW